jgi:hypothetical protein
VITAEELRIEDIDLDGTPPCDINDGYGHVCGRPSSLRVISRCDSCPKAISGFACTPCWSFLRPYIVFREWRCRFCHARRQVIES